MAGSAPGTDDAAVARIDEAISAYLGDWTHASLERVVATGSAGLRRLIEIYYGHRPAPGVPEFRTPASRRWSGREMADIWSEVLFECARACPRTYLDEVDAGRVRMRGAPVTELVVLGHIDDPRAVAPLLRYVRHRDWLVRYHAVRGLAGRDDPDSVAAVEQALTDRDLSVRLEAVTGVARRDPARALKLYQAIIDHPRVPPLLRTEAGSRLRALRRGPTGKQPT